MEKQKKILEEVTSIFIEESDDYSTPLIDFNFSTGVLRMVGESKPENVDVFYNPVIDKLKLFIEKPTEKIVCEVKLLYFNSGSSKKLMDILELLPKDCSKVIWYYPEDDPDMLEVGEEYYDLLDESISFEYKSFELSIKKERKSA